MSTHEASRPQPSVNYVKLRVSSQAIKTLKILEFVESVYSAVSFAEADFIWLNLETKRYSFKFKNELLVSSASLARPRDIAPLLLLSPEARYGYLHPEQS